MQDNRHIVRVIGTNIAKIRIDQSLSQEALSRMSGVSRQTINRMERGEFDMKVSSLCGVADALCVEVAVLFNEHLVAP